MLVAKIEIHEDEEAGDPTVDLYNALLQEFQIKTKSKFWALLKRYPPYCNSGGLKQ